MISLERLCDFTIYLLAGFQSNVKVKVKVKFVLWNLLHFRMRTPLDLKWWYLMYALTLTQCMVPTDHDIPFSRTFQGLLRYIFKDFSRTFLCSFKHPFAKQWTFQIRHTETIWSWVRQKKGEGRGVWVCVFNFFRRFAALWLYYSLKQFCLKGGGSSPRKFLLELVQNPAILDNSGGYTSLVIMPQ